MAGDVPADANQNCPGTESETAGKAEGCAGCPNQQLCASGEGKKGEDPDLPLILERMSKVKRKILVLSGKGGVGKSSFTAQLSQGLARDEDKEVGVLDLDICGPSMPLCLGVQGQTVHHSNQGWSPVYAQSNLSLISIAFMLPNPDDPVIWRGPKKNGLIKDFLKDVDWGNLDYLVVDTPPGTSDEHLSLVSLLKPTGIDGAVIITTPQEVALADVRKEVNFCKKVGIPILGLVENMSGFICPNCNKETEIFFPSTGGGKAMCEKMGVKYLGGIPLHPIVAKMADQGKSIFEEEEEVGAKRVIQAFDHIIQGIEEELAKSEMTD